MLRLLPTLRRSVEQVLVKGELEIRIVNSICKDLKVNVEQVSTNSTGMETLWLYYRNNFAGRREAGIIYESGPQYDEKEEGKFSGEVLRLFSKGRECDRTAASHYKKLVAQHKFIPIMIGRNIKPE